MKLIIIGVIVFVFLFSYKANTQTAENNPVPIYLNQSGFNLGAPKRFTAPTLGDGTPFQVVSSKSGKTLFKGIITNHIGDFSEFNPQSTDEFIVKAGGLSSFPFRIGHWWMERVTYQNAMDFMIESRHYFGNWKDTCQGSFGWRDDHHFAWELNTLVPQYLSNPEAYHRMPKKIFYQKREGFNGALDPYPKDAPDIIKLIHHGADVIVTQKLMHELLKEQLAFFLYAWPWIKHYLPKQNYNVVADYAFSNWRNEEKDREYPYDKSQGHNILALKTKIGTTKGELPPGHTVLPNLLLYEVAKREQRADAEDYFKAAYNQVEWMIDSLDWSDPLVTKGQRMSEHVTMTGLAHMLRHYPKRAPSGLADKIRLWKQVAISRSNNMWDFRKLSDSEWVPSGEKKTMWNEPGNVIGFPACALAAIGATPNDPQNQRLYELVWSHMDNAFGRNPTGRHFSYDAPREIEGCELGWYSFHKDGIGRLEDTRFVFDGAPKKEHYPYNPEAGNPGWSEGWVNFNVAFNLSLAYMAHDAIRIKGSWSNGQLDMRLKAPLNFDYNKQETVQVQIHFDDGSTRTVRLNEDSNNDAFFSGNLRPGIMPSKVSYGYGYFTVESLITQ